MIILLNKNAMKCKKYYNKLYSKTLNDNLVFREEKIFLNEWNASRLVGQARILELVFAFGARLISIVRPNNFECHFSTILVILGEKRLSPRKKNLRWKKIFDFVVFVLRYVSKHSESNPTKKIFDQNFWLRHFFTILVILGKND